MNRALKIKLTLFAVSLASLVWGFKAMLFDHAPAAFAAPLEDMSFAWYVPLFSLYVLWTERRKVLDAAAAPSPWALALVLPALFVGFIGTRGVQLRFEEIGFILLLLSIPWVFFGRRTAKAILFPVLFLLFCIPLATFLDIVTVHLRILASSVAYGVLRGFGAEVVQQGTAVLVPKSNFAIDIADPCSGLRSIFALMAFTAAYAYFNQPTWIRRGLLFATSVPLAVLGNVMRILSICLVGTYASGDFATGFYHDYSGYVVFAVAILLMIACGELITRLFRRFAPPLTEEPPLDPAVRRAGLDSGRRALVAPALCCALVTGMMLFQALTPDAEYPADIPMHLADLADCRWMAGEISATEKTVLPADTRIERRIYADARGGQFMVSLVASGRSKSSIHRPELCLPAQGFRMTSPRTRFAGGGDWRLLTLERNAEAPSLFAYTFVNQSGYRTSSHVGRIFRDVWDRSFFNRVDRWVMITVVAAHVNEREMVRFLEKTGGFEWPKE